MEQNELQNVIILYYEDWYKYCQKLCHQYNLEKETTDILHEVICSIMEKNKHTPVPWELTEAEGREKFKYYVMCALKYNIIFPSSPYQQHYHRTDKYCCRDSGYVPVVFPEQEEHSRWNMIWETYQQLELSEYDRKIFEFYYFDHHFLKQWTGPESISKLSKICSRICRQIRENLKKKGLSIVYSHIYRLSPGQEENQQESG